MEGSQPDRLDCCDQKYAPTYWKRAKKVATHVVSTDSRASEALNLTDHKVETSSSHIFLLDTTRLQESIRLYLLQYSNFTMFLLVDKIYLDDALALTHL